jgi:hypothetical protein
MFDSIKIQNQLNWLREQIECIKDNSCMCTHETDVLLSPGGVLTVIFTDGSVHSVTLPGNEVDGNIYTQSGVYDINTGLCTFTRTDGSVYYLNLNYLKTQAETALATATLSITRIDNLTGEVTSNTELISLLQEGLDNHLSDFNNPHQVTKEQVGLGDALVSGDNVSSLVNDAGYIVIGDVPPAPVITVAGKIGNVLLYKADILDLNEADYATAAQGLLADSALQSGDNISELNNDVGYITDYTVTESDVTQHQSALTITESQISDLNTFSGDYNDLTNQPDIPTDNNELTNGAGYITLSEVPSTPDALVDSVNGLTNDDGTVKLGGPLTEDTAITGNFELNLGNDVTNENLTYLKINAVQGEEIYAEAYPSSSTTNKVKIITNPGEINATVYSEDYQTQVLHTSGQYNISVDDYTTNQGAYVSLAGGSSGFGNRNNLNGASAFLTTVAAGYLSIGASNGSEQFSLELNTLDGRATFTDTRATPNGLEYSTDYSLTYSDRSLVDKGWVDAEIISSTVNVVDNLSSTSATDALSANQGRVLSDKILALEGSLILQGNWDALNNTPDISTTTNAGYYWIVSVDGATNLGGITDWKVNDWAIKTATGWSKIDNTDKVTSVNGVAGDVILDADDIETFVGSGITVLDALNNKADVTDLEDYLLKTKEAVGLQVIDTRVGNEPPSFYFGKVTKAEFKRTSIIALPDTSATYCSLETIGQWSESSGGYPTQIAKTTNGSMYQRVGTSDTTWSTWKKLSNEDDLGDYLPLTGGTLSGQLNANGGIIIDGDQTDYSQIIGAQLNFYGSATKYFRALTVGGQFAWQVNGNTSANPMILEANGQLKLTEKLNADNGIVVTKKGDGAEVLKLNIERSWSFYQKGAGSSASLLLGDNSGSKSFEIGRSVGNKEIGTVFLTPAQGSYGVLQKWKGSDVGNTDVAYVDSNGAGSFNGGVVAAGDISTTSGYLSSTNSGKTISIGSANAGFCHYVTTADRHYFNKTISAAGGFEVYNSANKLTSSGLEANNVKITTFEFGGQTIKRYVYKGGWNMVTTASISGTLTIGTWGKEIMSMKCMIQGDGATSFISNFTNDNVYYNLEKAGEVSIKDTTDTTSGFISEVRTWVLKRDNSVWSNTSEYNDRFDLANYTLTIDIIQ